MKQLLLGLLWSILITQAITVQAQYENIWAFGTKSGLDFNSGSPKPIFTNIGVYPGTDYAAFGEGNAAICDAKGNLLFYTEGFYIWDKNGNVMPNGRNLTPTYGLNLKNSPSSSTSQGTIIVPMPENEGKYYVFSLTAYETWQKRASDLYYSIVDISLNGGLGDVIADKKSILIDSFLAEKMTVVRGNKCNIWLLTCALNAATPATSEFKAFEITASGVSRNPVISKNGLGSILAPMGTLVASPNGKRVMATQGSLWGGREGAALYDFDANTGLLSNKLKLLECCGGYGAAFSPSSSMVYVCSYNSTIYQYNLNSNNPTLIEASALQLGASGFSHAKLGPDGKIYFISSKSGYLGRIAYPDSAGTACTYEQAAVAMLPGQKMHAGLPNTVAYVPEKESFSSQTAQAACWANVHPLTLFPTSQEEGWDYNWNDGVNSANRTVTKPGTYWVSYRTPPCHKHTDTFHVSFPYGVLPDIGIRQSCNGANNGLAWATTYPEDTVTYHYTWTNSKGTIKSTTDTLKDIPADTFSLRIQTAYCDTTISFVVPEKLIKVDFISDSIVCQGTPLQFWNQSDSGFTRFHWNFNTKDTASLRDPSYIFKHAGVYQVQLTGSDGACRDSISKWVVVDSQFTAKFSMEPDRICVGESITFSPEIDSSLIGLQWNFGNGVALQNGDVTKIQHAFDNAGRLPVTLEIQSRACPSAFFTDTVYVGDIPKIDLGQERNLCFQQNAITLSNQHKMPEDRYSFLWNTGANTDTITIVHPGDYSLSITSATFGCTATEWIKINKDCFVDLPNVFTPNGDGFNDYFFPRQILSEGLKTFHFSIVNRWGQQVFETTNLQGRGWDGSTNGQQQPQGVYVYQIEINFNQGKQERYQGNVTLMR